MTTFEITVIVLLAAIVVLLIALLRIDIEGFHGVWQNQNAGVEQLCNIEVNTHHASSVLKGHIAPDVKSISQQLGNIEDNILDDLRDIRLADKLDKTSPNVPTPLPCYSPNGICTNPQKDCINCPKRGTGGTWSTSTNLNKEE